MDPLTTEDVAHLDTEVLRRLQHGDREALRELFRKHMPLVYGAAYVVAGNKSDAEEAAQDAFFLLWQKRADITIVGDSALPWLIATARFHASNKRRAAARRPTVSIIDSTDRSSGPDPESAAIADELQRRLTAAIAALAPVDQELLQACLVDGLSYAEASAAVGVTHGTVRNRLSRAKQHIRLEIVSERTES